MGIAHIGKLIEKYRKKSKLSQLELSAMLEVEQSNICNWENGKYCPTLQNLIKLSDIFGLKLWAFLKEVDL